MADTEKGWYGESKRHSEAALKGKSEKPEFSKEDMPEKMSSGREKKKTFSGMKRTLEGFHDTVNIRDEWDATETDETLALSPQTRHTYFLCLTS